MGCDMGKSKNEDVDSSFIADIFECIVDSLIFIIDIQNIRSRYSCDKHTYYVCI